MSVYTRELRVRELQLAEHRYVDYLASQMGRLATTSYEERYRHNGHVEKQVNRIARQIVRDIKQLRWIRNQLILFQIESKLDLAVASWA